ncbi:MAG: hypothetical protein K0R14_213 [Burkholderiales bacterium]|jgi:hypothetical protein|nr:hypothetical protein [Burkholderiales bacterium]
MVKVMMKLLNIKNIKSSGFSVIELMGVLVVFAFIIISTHRIMDKMDQAKEYNQLADQSNLFSEFAIKYIQDHYRDLVGSTATGNYVILTANAIREYEPKILYPFNKMHQAPCVYVTKGLSNNIRAYIIFGRSSGIRSQNLSMLDIGTIAKAIGNNAGILTNINGNYSFTGGVDNLTIPSAIMTSISTTCGFSMPLAQNLLIVDLTKSSALFASIKGNIDQQTLDDSPDPSLKKSTATLTTMQTNIYLDNIYAESSTKTIYYCDASKLPGLEADSLCQNYAASGGIYMDPGSASWVDSQKTGDQCRATAQASFYRTVTSYDCNGANMGNAEDYCPATIDDRAKDPGSAYWNPIQPAFDPGTNTCSSEAYAYYKLPGTCDGPQWWINTANPSSRGDNDTAPNWQRAVSINGSIGEGIAFLISCAVKQPDDHDTMVHCPGTYNQSSGRCDIGLRCILSGLCKSQVVNTSFDPTGGGGREPNPRNCGRKVVPAIPTQHNIPLGTQTCGTKYYPMIPSTVGVPAQHTYRAIDYGRPGIAGRIQIKTKAPIGATSESSILAINGAGIQAGIISPISHMVTVGDTCSPNEVGKAVQGISSTTINSQVQCTYNPTFCPGYGYCYLPLKTTTFTYQFPNRKASYMCPMGTVVDSNQPADGIDTSISCPVITGWNLIQGLHGENTACYTSITKMNFCQGYQTVCSYAQGTQAVGALAKLKCTSATSAYVIDNYTR